MQIDMHGPCDVVMKRLRHSRSLRLSVSADGRVVLSRPFWISADKALAFLETNRGWLESRLSEYAQRKPSLLSQRGRERYLAEKDRARILVEQKIAYFNSHYCFKFSRISIRDQRSRWGSCSRQGGLSFNYRIIFLPEHLADYLIVHELCHLGEFSHGRPFWRLVSQMIPDYEKRRSELRLI